MRRLLSGEHDAAPAIVSINAGAGGTDACDWAEMLMRMYLRWAEDHGVKSEVLDLQHGEEAGVRGLERHIAAICRAVARRVAEQIDAVAAGEEHTQAGERPTQGEPELVTPDDLHGFLGPVRYFNDVAERTAIPGVATGLAWTPSGGDILFIEATRMPGKGKLTLTGQLGDVMKESAQAALSYLRSRAGVVGDVAQRVSSARDRLLGELEITVASIEAK